MNQLFHIFLKKSNFNLRIIDKGTGNQDNLVLFINKGLDCLLRGEGEIVDSSNILRSDSVITISKPSLTKKRLCISN